MFPQFWCCFCSPFIENHYTSNMFYCYYHHLYCTHVSFGNVRVFVTPWVVLHMLFDFVLEARGVRSLILIHAHFVSEEQECRRGRDVVGCRCSLQDTKKTLKRLSVRDVSESWNWHSMQRLSLHIYQYIYTVYTDHGLDPSLTYYGLNEETEQFNSKSTRKWTNGAVW